MLYNDCSHNNSTLCEENRTVLAREGKNIILRFWRTVRLKLCLKINIFFVFKEKEGINESIKNIIIFRCQIKPVHKTVFFYLPQAYDT